MRNSLLFAAVCLGLLCASTASAGQVFATSYDMLNGGAGTYTYHDDSYNGSGNPNVDYDALSGGLGDLTDGVVATQNWYTTPELYVGWASYDPLITFHFSGAQTFTSLRLYFDDSDGAGGVSPPGSVDINGMNFVINSNPNVNGLPYYQDFNLSGLTTDTIDLTVHRVNVWIMVSEVTFAAVPEPATFALASFGALGLLAVVRRNRPVA